MSMRTRFKYNNALLRLVLGALLLLLGGCRFRDPPSPEGPSLSGLCQALERDLKDPLCHQPENIKQLLEESFPYGETTASDVYKVLFPYRMHWRTTSTGTIGTENYIVLDAMFFPVVAGFDYDEKETLIHIEIIDE